MPRLLARGIPPEQVRWTTGVPAALVALIGQEEPESASPPRAGNSQHRPLPSASPRAALPPLLQRLATLAVYAAGTAATIVWHQPVMLLAVAGAALIAGGRSR